METRYLILVAEFVFCLVVSFAFFSTLTHKDAFRQNRLLMPVLYAVFILALAGVIFIEPRFYDFVTDADSADFSLAAAGLALPFLLSAFVSRRWFLPAVIAVSAALTVFLQPDFYIDFYAAFPLWLNRILTVLLWLAAAFAFRLLNGVDGLVPLEGLTVGFGIFILSLIGGLPYLLGAGGLAFAALSAALLLYNAYPAKISLNDNSCDLYGFLCGWLLIFAAVEGAGAPVCIFSLLLICETGWALLKRLTFLPAYRDLRANPVYLQAAAGGLSPSVILNFNGRLNILLLLFGCFQVFAPNAFSLPLLCTVIVIWQLYRLQNWQNLPKNLTEINQQFVRDLKSGVQDLKETLRKDN